MTQVLQNCVVVGLAGAAGAIARYLVSLACVRMFGTSFPVGTLAINVGGSLLLGWFLMALDQRVIAFSDDMRLAVAVGFCGAFTTYSTFAWETDALARNAMPWRAILNVAASLALGLAAVRLGAWLAVR
jgi:fluoride exporter